MPTRDHVWRRSVFSGIRQDVETLVRDNVFAIIDE
jgi:hypothetical protein